MTMDIVVDKEFQSKIPPITQEEFHTLEANILADGVIRDPLVVWGNVLVDGHNRLRILQKHPELQFFTCNVEFQNRDEAIAWICRNQLGRRNLTPENRMYLLGKQYEAEKKSHGGHMKDPNFIPAGESTSERIARENNTSAKTVMRAAQYCKGIDMAEEVRPGIREAILSRKIRVTMKEAMSIAAAAEDERESFIRLLGAHTTRFENTASKEQKVERVAALIDALRSLLDNLAAEISYDNHVAGA